MTIASLLLALLTATTAPKNISTGEPLLLDFHAEWCGPCQKARPAVQQLIRRGYQVKTIDIDQEPGLAERFHVKSIPTFIVVDGVGRELDRTMGPQPAAELARFYKAAIAKAQPPASSNAHTGSREETGAGAGDEDDQGAAGKKSRRNNDHDRREDDPDNDEPALTNPKPWETVVRIRVISKHSTGFGSGTIIYSTPEESLILTCAHIFKLEGRRPVAPSQFPRRIMVDLFDGNLQGTKPAKVHFLEPVEGWAVDYDFTRDVGLVRIRPGRRLPACRVVPSHWEPQSRMQVLTVGCSEGHDATAWHTIINRPRIQNFLAGNSTYEAIECEVAPKQGRSGGGLFTTDGYIAGVCNFAEPQGNHGLYATPRSIYSLLDRNNLAALYAPVSRGSAALVAGRSGVRSRRNPPVSVARSQSPDTDEPDRSRARADNGEVTVPHPSLLGIAEPVAVPGESAPQAASVTTRRTAWQPHSIPVAATPGNGQRAKRAEPTELNLGLPADHDRFGPPPGDPRTQNGSVEQTDSISRPNAISPVASPARSGWRPVRAPADQKSAMPAN